jgi:tetratricopeptide (TPR) repeat protein
MACLVSVARWSYLAHIADCLFKDDPGPAPPHLPPDLPPAIYKGKPMANLNATPLSTRHRATKLVWAMCLPLILAGCQTAASLREEGRLALNRGQYARALEKSSLAVEKDPSSARCQYQLGLAYLALDRGFEAQYALEKAHALAPHDKSLTPDILDALAEALFQQDRSANLYAFLDKMVETYATTRDYLRQAEYLARSGDPDAARLSFRKAAYFADPGDAEPYIAIADFYTSISDQPNAVTALRYANYVAPGNLAVAERLRKFGIVPGPTIAQAPPKPALLR